MTSATSSERSASAPRTGSVRPSSASTSSPWWSTAGSYLACVPTHHLDSARISRDLLRERGWPAHIVDAACRCIASHSAPVAPGDGSVEEVCVSNADVMAQLARPAYWFFYLHRVRGFDHDEGLAWWRTRLERGWSGLVEDARAIVAAEHGAVVRILAASAQAS